MLITCLELFWSYVKVGFCSFGGLSMIPLLSDEMLSHGWMTTQQLSDIVAIAEMTPGSLGINCATFVGIQIAGTAGMLFATLGVMVPSLTLCMVVAHFLVKFKDNRHLRDALYGIRPVCLGMIVAVVFPMMQTNYWIDNTLSWQAVLIGLISCVLLIRFRWSVPKVICLAAAGGLLLVR